MNQWVNHIDSICLFKLGLPHFVLINSPWTSAFLLVEMNRYARSPPRIDGMVSLKVDNLAYRTTIEDLRKVFSRYGEVGMSVLSVLTILGDIYIPRDPYTFESRGFAFVRYCSDREADNAIRGMDGRRLDGREVRVQRAKYGRPTPNRRRWALFR